MPINITGTVTCPVCNGTWHAKPREPLAYASIYGVHTDPFTYPDDWIIVQTVRYYNSITVCSMQCAGVYCLKVHNDAMEVKRTKREAPKKQTAYQEYTNGLARRLLELLGI